MGFPQITGNTKLETILERLKNLSFLYLSNKDTNVSELTQTVLYNTELGTRL